MQASETKLRDLLEGTKQYVVPLFQRPYSWTKKQWRTLWEDVREKSRHEDARPHFFGSIVTAPAKSVPQGVGKYLLIDGQQRLTTIQVLLAAIRDLAESRENARLRDRINGQFLTNQYERGEERLKVLPTQADRSAFSAIVQQEEKSKSPLSDCHRFFLSQLDFLDDDRLDAIHRAVVDRFSVVSITCDEYDNPHLIFESLNAKGEKLTPADLIRNFLLMQVHVDAQDRLFQAYWRPIQEALGADLTEFVRHYLMREGMILNAADVYFELKDRLANSSPGEAEEFLKDLHRHGLFYARFLDPSRESDAELASRLDRVRRLKVTVAHPFLLRVFDAHEAGTLSKEQVVEALDVLESFVIRRLVCNRPTNQLRKIFPPVFDDAGGAGPEFGEGLRRELGGSRCPDDEAFAHALQTEPLYSTSEKNARLRLILERLERSFGHKERVELAGATIEHVLPQELSAVWRRDLGEDADARVEPLLHTLGNLTLTGYNSELSNKPYAEKREELLKSHFELNRYFAEVQQWTPEAILDRGRSLTRKALEVWPDVGRSSRPDEIKRSATRRPQKVRFRGVEHPVKNWKSAYIKLLTLFDEASPGLLNRLVAEGALNAVLASDESRFRRSKERVGTVVVNTHASASQLQSWCLRIAEAAGIGIHEFDYVLSEPASKPAG